MLTVCKNKTHHSLKETNRIQTFNNVKSTRAIIESQINIYIQKWNTVIYSYKKKGNQERRRDVIDNNRQES